MRATAIVICGLGFVRMRRLTWARARAPAPARALAVAAGLCALALLAGTAAAQEDWTETPVEQLATNEALVGQRLRIDAKVVLVSGNTLIVRDSDVSLVLEASVARVARELNEGDNIRAYGTLARDNLGRRTFVVRRLERRPDDATLFRDELERLKARNDRAGLFALGERAEREFGRGANPVVREIGLDAYRAAIALEAAAAAPGDAAAAIRLADLYVRRLGDRRAALEWLLKAFPPGEFPPPEVRDRLTSKEVNAVPYAGEWVLYEDMKQREGFVLREGEWVLAERAAFLDAVEQQMRDPRRDRVAAVPDFFIEAAKNGRVELGMLKREVALAIGFPDAVDRVRRTDPGGRVRVFDAWLYEGRGQYIFEDDVLFRKP